MNDLVPAVGHQYYPQSPYKYDRSSSGVSSPHYNVGEKRLYRMTSVSLFLLCRLYMGQEASHPHVAAQLAFLTRTKPGQTDPEHVRYAKLTTVGDLANTDINQYDIYTIYYLSLALHQLGASQWSDWVEGNPPRFLWYPEHLMSLRVDKTASTTDDKWYSDASSPTTDKGSWHYTLGCWAARGPIYPTTLAVMCHELSVADYLPGSKWCVAGAHSYGYNKLLGITRRTPAQDTIVLMDYSRWGIDAADPSDFFVPRHSGEANVLFADGRVEAVALQEIVEPATNRIKAGLLTLDPGD